MNNYSTNFSLYDQSELTLTAQQKREELDLFAEELPTQNDLKPTQTFGSIGTAACATGGGSTFSTLSSFSSL